MFDKTFILGKCTVYMYINVFKLFRITVIFYTIKWNREGGGGT